MRGCLRFLQRLRLSEAWWNPGLRWVFYKGCASPGLGGIRGFVGFSTKVAPLRGLAESGVVCWVFYKGCASPRLGGIRGCLRFLQRLRLSEAWRNPGLSAFSTKVAPLRGLAESGVVCVFYKGCASPGLGGIRGCLRFSTKVVPLRGLAESGASLGFSTKVAPLRGLVESGASLGFSTKVRLLRGLARAASEKPNLCRNSESYNNRSLGEAQLTGGQVVRTPPSPLLQPRQKLNHIPNLPLRHDVAHRRHTRG